MDGLPLLVDDFYVFGFLAQTEIVHFRGRKVSCRPVAKQIVARITMMVQEVLGERRRNVTITNTVLANAKYSKIVDTIAKIEHRRARENWEKLFPERKLCAYFAAKIDVSEAEIGRLQKSLLTLCRLLECRGDGIHQIDYPQDFSGVLDRKGWSSICKKIRSKCKTPANTPKKVAFSTTQCRRSRLHLDA